MKNENTKEKLILATIKLLSINQDPTQITARQIVAEAKTNLAMINYCFKSKEALMNIAIGRIIASSANRFKVIQDEGITLKEQLKRMLYDLCEITVSYSQFTKISIPYILLQDEITLPLDILPIIKEYFDTKKSETECRIIAYQMISFMQLIFLRSEDFMKYSGINIFNAEERNNLIDMQINLFLGDEK
ncbi:MAG: AcrR family transcriptional regulator [Clostridium sp.]|jgi:AcrR family transcriptional regulator